jgi:hypothetical protein
VIGQYAVAIGHEAGADMPSSAQHWIIIGDGVRDLTPRDDVLHINAPDGVQVAIGKTVLGEACNLQEIVLPYIAGVFGVPR